MKYLFYLRYIFLFFLLLINYSAVAENDNDSFLSTHISRKDSLKHVLHSQPLNEEQKMEIYGYLAFEYQHFDQDSTQYYAIKSAELAQKFKEYGFLINLYVTLGVSHCFKGNFDTALYYFNQGKEVAIKHGYKKQELLTIKMTAYAYAKQGKFNTAIDYFLKVLNLYEKNDWTNEREYISTLTNLSEINRRIGNTEMALQYLNLADNKCNELNIHIWTKSHVWNEYAFNYLKQGKLEYALHFALKTEADKIEAGIVNRCYAEGLLATIYLKQNKLDSAIYYAQQAYSDAETLNDISLYAYAGKILSDLYLATKQYAKAEAAALKIWNTDSTNMDESRNAVENIVLANIYMGNTEKAVLFFKKYLELTQQYSEKSFQTTVSDLSIKYDTEKKEMRITILEKEKDFILWIGFAGAIILLLIIGLLFFRYRFSIQKRKTAEQQLKQVKQEQELIATQAVLDGETAERSRLARDLHDGLGGMLSVVKLNLKDMKHSAMMELPDVERFSTAISMLDQSIGELRRVAHHIMPESLMRYGLKVSLEDFCHAISNAHFQYIGEDSRLDNRLEVMIYRCAYELVNNATKHASATAINVQLMIDDGLISLTVQDNGVGFDPLTITSGMGLENIRARIAVYNGKMSIRSSPETGTEICIEIEKS